MINFRATRTSTRTGYAVSFNLTYVRTYATPKFADAPAAGPAAATLSHAAARNLPPRLRFHHAPKPEIHRVDP